MPGGKPEAALSAIWLKRDAATIHVPIVHERHRRRDRQIERQQPRRLYETLRRAIAKFILRGHNMLCRQAFSFAENLATF